MIKLNRTTEYGLMALRHMNRKRSVSQSHEVTSAREVADSYGLPFEITAKTLQRLKDSGLIESAQGSRGGYTLRRQLSDVSLAEFLELMEGPQAIVLCTTETLETKTEGSCEYHGRCEIKRMMSHLNERVYRFLSEIHLAELAEGSICFESGLGNEP